MRGSYHFSVQEGIWQEKQHFTFYGSKWLSQEVFLAIPLVSGSIAAHFPLSCFSIQKGQSGVSPGYVSAVV